MWGKTSGQVSVWHRQIPGQTAIDRQKWFTWPRDEKTIVEYIESLSDHDVYIPVSVFRKQERKPEYAVTTATIWNDTDLFDPTQYRIQPSIVVTTSEGRSHCWWTLDKDYPAEQTETITRKLTYAHVKGGADISSWSRAKLLRVPGTVNTSHGFPEDVTAEFTDRVYTLQEIAEAYDDIPLTPVVSGSEIPSTPLPAERPDFLTATEKLPVDFDLKLVTEEPAEGSRSEMRWKLLSELVEAGLDDAEVFAVAWEAKCSDKWREDPRGEDGLWAEILKERVRYDTKTANPPDVVPVTEAPTRKPKRIEILTADERKAAKRHYTKTFLQEYEDWTRASVSIYNAPYHRAGAWTALSNLVGSCAYINLSDRDIPLNLYTMVLGPTTTGKSQAKSLMQRVIHGGYSKEQNPDLGSDASREGLQERLRKNEGRSALLLSDEVDGLLQQMRDKGGWHSSLMPFYTELYDGRLMPQIRRGEVTGEWSHTVFSIFGMGTEVKVKEELDKQMFESGFLARFQWYIGESIEVPLDKLGVQFGSKQRIKKSTEKIEEWCKRFSVIREDWTFRAVMINHEKAYVWPDAEETATFLKAKTGYLEKNLFAGKRNEDILRPSLTRLNISVAKMAALLALSRGEEMFTMGDVLVALYQAEESLTNLSYIADEIADSDHSKQLSELESMIANRHGSQIKSYELYKMTSARWGLTNKETDGLMEELKQQRRASSQRNSDGVGLIYFLVESKEEK